MAATLQRKSSGGTIFVINTEKITKENVPRNYFVIFSARMVQSTSDFWDSELWITVTVVAAPIINFMLQLQQQAELPGTSLIAMTHYSYSFFSGGINYQFRYRIGLFLLNLVTVSLPIVPCQ